MRGRHHVADGESVHRVGVPDRIALASVGWAVTAVGVIAQGIRFGTTWVDHDRQSAARAGESAQ